ncbi:hypothetical protein RF11_09777 [Thelohanellus kitauei]|uniref:Uncharacterized protein n=1 Tax=Thelohanellus kitauei TaxID=669202 RepID=A0A0C2MKA1_THEKT|nr:hypothetical protein RF11_09777 [Thelohanellus kitauei]
MDSSQNTDNDTRQRVKDEYITKSRSSELSVQIEAVKIVISFFSNEIDRALDYLFMQNFPKELYDELRHMSDSTANSEYSRSRRLFKTFNNGSQDDPASKIA